MGNVRVTSHIIPWANATESKIDKAMLVAVTDIDRESAILAPKLTRALVKSKKINRYGMGWYSVSYGNSQVPYARRRHFENKAHPATLRYLERAGDSVGNRIARYFK